MTKTQDEQRRDLLKKAQEVIGIPMSSIDKTGRLQSGKGAIGTVIEESWFGYKPNSESEPDFPEAGLELKVTPYIRRGREIRAKERLVCNIINYMTEHLKTFETSDFWKKCNTLLIMSYEHRFNIEKGKFTIDNAVIFGFPSEDLAIIIQDWNKIIAKIREGKAHLLTEGDTLYLAACTKGKDSSSVRKQPFSDIPAKSRAYSLKSSYMTMILNDYIFGHKKDEHIIKDWKQLIHKKFEDLIIEKIKPYYGLTRSELSKKFGIDSNSKNIYSILLARMLGINGEVNNTSEFKSANIIAKTIRVQRNGRIKESMSFPTFDFRKIVNETWETSELREMLEPTKFMFVIFNEQSEDEYVLDRVKFWNIPMQDLDEVRKVWERTVGILKEGVQLIYNGKVIHNNLPKMTENRVAHVRPHARNAEDTCFLPDGRKMTKQCFWLNNSYVASVINCELIEYQTGYDQSEYTSMVAENASEYNTNNDES